MVESRKVANTNTDKNTNTITELVEAGEEEGAKTVGGVEKGRCLRTVDDLLWYNSLQIAAADGWFYNF